MQHPSRSLPGLSAFRWIGLAAVVWIAFVVYGSLVPFDFRGKPLADAFTAFRGIRYLQLGIESRADWVANILLYIPVGFLISGRIAGASPSLARSLSAAATALIVGMTLAVAVEFAQLFFPPRTVSKNDLIAEAIGTLLGTALWFTIGLRVLTLTRRSWHGGPTGTRAALALYTIAYLLLCFFPFDFVVSGAELAAKFAQGPRSGWLVAPACGRLLGCSVRLGAEILVTVPIGILLGLLWRGGRMRGLRRAFGMGVLVGLVIEVAQFFLASGVSQGISVLTRAAGIAWGYLLTRHAGQWWFVRHETLVRRFAWVLAPVYVASLAAVTGLFSRGLEPLSVAISKLQRVRFLPFYYHYYTTESDALQSLLMQAIAYAPTGLFVWILGRRGNRGATPLLAGGIAAVLAIAMEGLKLFLSGRHPDPTNVLIAFASASMVLLGASRLASGPLEGAPTPLPEESPGTRPYGVALATIAMVAALVLGTWLLVTQPTETFVDESTLARLSPGDALPPVSLPKFREAHPRLPHPSPADLETLRKLNPGFLEARRRAAGGGRGDIESAVLIELAEPGSIDLPLLHSRLMALKFSSRGHEQAKPLALAYDWLYSRWSPAQRTALQGKLDEGCNYLIRFIREARLSPYNVILYSSPLQALTACAIVLYRDDPRGESTMRFTYDLWKNRVLPVWRQVMGRNGGWHEGAEYVGVGIGQAIYQVPAMWREAAGEDAFRAEPGIRGFLDFLVYRTRPDGTNFRWGDGASFERIVPDSIPLALEFRHPAAYSLRPPVPEPLPSSWPWGPLTDTSLVDPAAASRLPLTRVFDGLGLVVARSDWSAEATYVTFKAGNNYWSHSHLDQGAFTIYKGGELAIDSGLYGSSYGSDHHMNYAYQTIAHNTVTVTDPEDTVPAPRNENPRPIANDGGQRRIGSGWGVEAAPLDIYEWMRKGDTYRTGEIKRLLDADGLTVAVADVTPAYTNDRSGKGTFSHRTRRVERFWRVFAYDRVEDVIVVFDTIRATDPAFRKRWLLHTLEQPRIGKDRFSVTVSPQDRPGKRGGRLEGRVLLPRDAQINVIGGKGFEFFVDGKNYDEAGTIQRIAAKRGAGGPEPGAWRIEVTPELDRKDDNFLVVLLPASLDEAGPREVRLIEADGKVGSEITGPTRTTRWWFQPESLGVSVEVKDAGRSRQHIVRLGESDPPDEPSTGWLGRIGRAIGVAR